MIQKLAVLSGLVLSATCMVFHPPSVPLQFSLQYNHDPNYNFAYEVNDAHTGDFKSQHESRRGDTVLGQYSLLQSDGITRTVDYRADDHSGFEAAVSNDRATLAALAATRLSSASSETYQQWPITSYPASATSGAVSRTSFIQSIAHNPVSRNPWP